MNAVTPEQVLKVLEITDSFSLHRESVFIPLATAAEGSATILPEGRLKITCPNHDFENWVGELKAELHKMNLSLVKH